MLLWVDSGSGDLRLGVHQDLSSWWRPRGVAAPPGRLGWSDGHSPAPDGHSQATASTDERPGAKRRLLQDRPAMRRSGRDREWEEPLLVEAARCLRVSRRTLDR
jgi:hypothetical protein